MAKANGSTRASASNSPRGLANPSTPNTRGFEENEQLAERLYSIGGLTVDPGDATYTRATDLAATDGGRSIEESIEGSTDYFAQATRDYVQVGNNGLDAGEAMREWGADDMVTIPYRDRSLMDIIRELRTSNVADIYRRYK